MYSDSTLLTVIVTVYNVDSYISNCIESLMRQTYKNIEILLIDDGSTDDSGKICDAYALRDKRIKVYHKENEGVVLARKLGVELANGEIVTFVDGDDWIENDMYEYMVNVYIKMKPEIITSGLTFECGEERTIVLDGISEGIYERESISKNILPGLAYDINTERQGITASVCNKLFSRTVLQEVLKNMDPQLTLGEDGAIVYSLVPQVDKIVIIHHSWYHYIQHDNSANRTYGFASFEKLYRLKQCLMEEHKKIGMEDTMKSQVEYYVKSFMCLVLDSLYGFDMRECAYLFPYEEVPKNSKIILYGAGKVGCSYWKCLQVTEYVDVVGWTDKNHVELKKHGFPIEPFEDMAAEKYDYIVIAINNEEVAAEVKNLLLDYGVKSEKIIWKKRKMIW